MGNRGCLMPFLHHWRWLNSVTSMPPKNWRISWLLLWGKRWRPPCAAPRRLWSFLQQRQGNEDSCSLAGLIPFFIRPGNVSSISPPPQGRFLLAAGWLLARRSLKIPGIKKKHEWESQYKVTEEKAAGNWKISALDDIAAISTRV